MKLTSSIITVLGVTGLASAAISPQDVFKRAGRPKPIIEKRIPNQPFKSERLQKRAFNFKNNATEKFVVNGTGIPDVPYVSSLGHNPSQTI